MMKRSYDDEMDKSFFKIQRICLTFLGPVENGQIPVATRTLLDLFELPCPSSLPKVVGVICALRVEVSCLGLHELGLSKPRVFH